MSMSGSPRMNGSSHLGGSPRMKLSFDGGDSPSPSRLNSFDSSGYESEELLVASLKAARESMKNLDQANKELIEALEDSQQEIERLSGEGMNLQARYRTIVEKNQADENLIVTLREEIEVLKRQNISSNEADAKAAREKIASLEDLIAELRMQLSTANDSKKTFENKSKEQVSEIEELYEVVKGLENEIKDLKASNTEKDKTNGDLQKEIVTLKNNLHQNESLADLHSKDVAEIRDLRNELNRAQQDLRGTRNTLVTCENEVASLKKELTSSNDALRDAKSMISLLEREIADANKDAEKKIEALEKDLERSQQKVLQFNDEISKAKIDLMEANAALKSEKSRNEELADARHSNEELSKEIARLWGELNTSEQSRHATDDQLVNAHEQVSQLTTEIADLNTKLDDKHSRLQLLENELNAKSREMGLLKTVEAEKDDVINSLNNQSLDTNVRLELLKKDVDFLQAQKNDADCLNSSLREELDAVKQSIPSMKAEIKDLDGNNYRLKQELANADDSNRISESRCNDLMNKVADLEEKISALLEEKVKLGYDLELANKNTGSVRQEYEAKNEMLNQQIIDLKEQLKNARADNELLHQEAKDASNQPVPSLNNASEIARLESTVESQKSQLDLLREKLNNLRLDLSESMHAREILEKEKGVLASNLAKVEQAKETADAETGVAKERQSVLECELREVRVDLKKVNDDVARLSPNVAVLESKCKMQSDIIDELHARLNASLSDAKELQKQLTLTNNSLSSAENALSAAERASSDYQKKLRDALDQIGSLESTIRTTAGENHVLQQELEKKKPLLESRGEKIDELNNTIAGMEADIIEFKKMAHEFDEMQKREDYETKCKVMERELPDALNKLAAALATIELLQEEVRNANHREKQATSDLDACRNDLKEAQIQSSSMGEEADTAQQLLDEATAMLKDKDSIITSMKLTADELKEKNNDLNTHLAVLLKDISSGKKDDGLSTIANVEAELRRSQVAQAQVEMELKHTTTELASLQGRFDVQNDRLIHAEEIVSDLRTKLNESQRKNDLMIKETGAVVDKLAFVESNNAELTTALKLLNENFDALTKEYSALNDNHETDKFGYEEKYRDLLSQKEDCVHSNEELAKEVKRLWQELNTSEESRHKADNNLLATTKEKSHLESELHDLKVKCATFQFEVTRSQDKTSKLSSQLDIIQEDLSDKTSLVDDLRNNLGAAHNKSLQLNLEKNALETELRKAEKILEQKDDELTIANEKGRALESEIRRLEDKLKDAQMELEKCTVRVRETEEESDVLKVKVDKLQTVNSSLRDENKTKDHELELINKDLFYVKSELAKTEANLATSKDDLVAAELKADNLQGKVSALMAKDALTSSSKSSSSDKSNEMELLKSRLDEAAAANESISALRMELADSRHAAELAQKDAVQSRVELAKLEQAKSNQESDLLYAREKLKAYEEDMRSLRTDIAKVSEELSSTTPKLAVVESKATMQKEKIDELNDEMLRLRNENAQLNSQLTRANDLTSNLKGKVESSTNSASTFERKYLDAQHQIASLEHHVEETLKEMDEGKERFKSQLAGLERQLESQGKEVDELNDVIAGLERELQESRTDKLNAVPPLDSDAKIAELERLLQAVQVEAAASSSGVELISEEVERAQTAVKLLESDLGSAKMTLKEKDEKLACLALKLEAFEGMMKEAQCKLQDRDFNIESLSSRNEELVRKNTVLEESIHELKKGIDAALNSVAISNATSQEDIASELEIVKLELARAQSDISSLSNANIMQTDRANRFESMADNLRDELNNTQKRAEGLAKDVYYHQDKLKEATDMASKKVANAESVCDSMKHAMKLLEDECSRANMELKDKTAEYNEWYEFYKKEKADCEHSNELLSKEIARLWDELQVSEQSRLEADGNQMESHKKLSELESALRGARLMTSKVQSDLSDMTAKYDAASEEKELSLANLKGKENEVSCLESELREARHTIELMKKDVASAQVNGMKTIDELEKRNLQIQNLEEDLSQTKEYLRVSRLEYDKVMKELNAAEADRQRHAMNIEVLTEERATFKTQNTDKDSEIQQLKAVYSKLERAYDELETKNKEMQGQLSHANEAKHQKIFELNDKVSQLHEITQVAFDVNSTNVSLQELQRRYDSQADVLSKVNAKLSEQRDQITDSRIANEVAARDLSATKLELDRSQMRYERLEIDMMAANEKIKVLEDEARRYRSEVATHKDNALGLLPEMEVLKDNNKSSERRIKELVDELYNVREMFTKCQGEVLAMRTLRDAAEKRAVVAEKLLNESNRAPNESLESNLAATQEALQKSQNSVVILNGEVAALKKANKILEDTHQSVQQAHADSLETVKGQVAIIASGAGDSEEMKGVKIKLEKAESLHTEKTRELELMKRQVELLTAESNRKDGDLDYARKDISSKITELKNRAEEIECLKASYYEVDRDRAKLRSVLDLSIKDVENLKGEIQRLHTESRNLEQEKIAAEMKCKTVDDDSDQVSSQLRNAEAEIDKLQKELVTTRYEKQTAQDGLERQIDAATKAESISEDLRASLKQVQQDNVDLSKTLGHMEARLLNQPGGEEGTLKLATNTIITLEKCIEELQAALKRSREDLTSSSAKYLEELASLREDSNNALQKIKEEYNGAVRSNDKLQEELSTKNAEIQSKTDQANTCVAQKKSADAQIEKLKTSMEKLKDDHTKELQNMRNDLEKLNKNLMTVEKELGIKNVELKSSSDQANAYLSQKNLAEAEIEKLKSKIEALRSEQEKELRRVNNDNKRMTNEIITLQQTLGVKSSELDNKTECAAKAESEIKELKASIVKLNNDQANDLQRSLNECSKLTKEIEELKQQLTVKNTEVQGKSEQAGFYLKQKEMADAQIKDLQSAIQKLHTDHTNELQKFMEENKKLAGSVGAIQQELSVKNSQLEGKVELIENLRKQKDAADLDLQRLKVSVEKMKSEQIKELQKSREDIKKLVSDNHVIQQELLVSKSDLKGKTEQASEYLKRNNYLDAEIEKLTGVISRLEADLQAQVASADFHSKKVVDVEKALATAKADQAKSSYDLQLALKDSSNYSDAFSNAQRTIKEGADRICKLEATLADNQKIIAGLTDGLAELKELRANDKNIDPALYAKLEGKYANLESDCSKLRDDLMGANAKNARLTGEVSKLQLSMEEAAKEKAAKSKELQELKKSSEVEIKELRAIQQQAAMEAKEVAKDLQGQITMARQKSKAELAAREQKIAADMVNMQQKLNSKEEELASALKNLAETKDNFTAKIHEYEVQVKELSVKLDYANNKVSTHSDEKTTIETHIKEKDQELQRLNRESSQKQAELEYQLQHALSHANRLNKDLEVSEEKCKRMEQDMAKLTPRSQVESKVKEYENKLKILNVKLDHAAKTIENNEKLATVENEKLRKAEGEVSKLNGQLLEAEAKLQHASDELSNNNSDAEQRAEALQKSADEIAKLSSLLASTERKLLKMTDNFSQSVESMKIKDEEIKRIVNELAINGSDKDIVKKELGDALKRANDLEESLKAADERIADFQPSLDRLQKEAEDSLAAADENLKDVTDKLAAETTARKEKEEALEKALRDLQSFKQTQHNPQDSQIQTPHAQVESNKEPQTATVMVKQGDEEIGRLNALNKQLENKLKNADVEIESLKQSKHKLADEKTAAKIAQLENELVALKQQKDTAVNEKEAMRRVSVALTGNESSDKLKELLKITKEDNNRLSKSNKDLVNENQSMRGKIANLEKQVKELREDNEMLDENQMTLRKAQAKEIGRLNDIIVAKLAEKDGEIDELRQKLRMQTYTVDTSFDEGQTSHEVSFDTGDPSKDKDKLSEISARGSEVRTPDARVGADVKDTEREAAQTQEQQQQGNIGDNRRKSMFGTLFGLFAPVEEESSDDNKDNGNDGRIGKPEGENVHTPSHINEHDLHRLATLIVAIARGYLTRKHVAKKMCKLPHVIFIELIRAEGLVAPADTYILANSIEKHKHKESCYSTVKSDSVKNSSHPVYDEEIRLYLADRSSKVSLNIFGSSWTGDYLMGQAVIDVKNYPKLYTKGEITSEIELKISRPKYTVFDSDGRVTGARSSYEQGKLFVRMRIPPLRNNMVGLFWSINDHAGMFFNDIKGTKIFVELCGDEIFVFEGAIDDNQVFDTKNPRSGITMKKIALADIVSVEENQSHQVEIKFDRLQLKMKDGSILNWAWGGDSSNFKGHWRKCFRSFADIKFRSSQSIKEEKLGVSSSSH